MPKGSFERFGRVAGNARAGFTRLDLVVGIATIAVLGVLMLSASANTKDRSERAMCISNLRHIGRAFHLWSADHGGQTPCIVSYQDGGLRGPPAGATISLPGVGTFPAAAHRNAWVHFLWMHRELETPAVLACPSDATRRRARTFAYDPNGGFSHIGYQNSALSYFVGLHPYPEFPASLLAGERHLSGTTPGSNCGVVGFTANAVWGNNNGRIGWASSIHDGVGNLVLNDGRVEEHSVRTVNSFFGQDNDCVQHFLFP